MEKGWMSGYSIIALLVNMVNEWDLEIGYVRTECSKVLFQQRKFSIPMIVCTNPIVRRKRGRKMTLDKFDLMGGLYLTVIISGLAIMFLHLIGVI
jgi:hypothetical protein